MIYFILSILMYLVQDFSNKSFCLKVGKTSFGTALIQNAVCCICSSLTLVVGGGVVMLQPSHMLLAALFGLSFLGTVFLLLCAFMHGTVGLSTLICNIGMFVAAFYGIIRFGDGFTPFIAAGYVCMLLAVILSSPIGVSERGGVKWFLLALGSGISNGIVASVKREAVGIIADDIQSFLAFGFLFAGLIAAVFAFSLKKCRDDVICVISSPKIMLFGVFAGIGGVMANLFQMKSLVTLPSTVVYPLTSGMLVVILWLASVFIYKEAKIKPRNIAAIIFCLMAILFSNF